MKTTTAAIPTQHTPLKSVHDISTPLQKDGLKAQIGQRLAVSIFARQFKAGERLIVLPLAKQFGVSRTPVREALMELETLGMVDVLPHRGAQVRPFGVKQARELFQVRKMLEREAISGACGAIPEETLLKLRDDLKEVIASAPSTRSGDRTRELDHELHSTIASYCQNQRLQDEIARYWSIFRALADAYYILLEASERYVRLEENHEHLAIVEALISGDMLASQQAMDHHLDVCLEDLIDDRFIEDQDS
ncbi:GntR family transcriptional regulator [Bremerella sp. JC770]|uniref:GntR family transcriptional regulator n=1 Tax=Bremerella sp. JC770 TaxID=3232137 RepID=UPI0034581D51